MRVFSILICLLFVIALAGCETEAGCRSPYMQMGDECCLDANTDGICDIDELRQSSSEDSVLIEKIKVNAFFSYENPQHGFRMKYPAEWEFIDKPYEVQFEPLENSYQETFIILSEDMTDDTYDADKYLQRYINGVKYELPDFKILTFEDETIHGNEAKKITFTFDSVSSRLKEAIFTTIHDDVGYTMIYRAEIVHFEKFKDNIKYMMETFQLPNRKEGQPLEKEEKVVQEEIQPPDLPDCYADKDCETPMDYLVRSICPYTSKCIDGDCKIVCPIMSIVNENMTLPLSCDSDDFCDCSSHSVNVTQECKCIDEQCYAVI